MHWLHWWQELQRSSVNFMKTGEQDYMTFQGHILVPYASETVFPYGNKEIGREQTTNEIIVLVLWEQKQIQKD